MLKRIARLEKSSKQLEGSNNSRQENIDTVINYTQDYLSTLSTRKGFVTHSNSDKKLNNFSFEKDPKSITTILNQFDEFVNKPGLLASSGRHLAYVPGGGVPAAGLGDYIAAISNEYAGVFFASPGAVRIENQVINWMGEGLGLKGNFGGNLSSGGSIANLTAIVAARDNKNIKGKDYHRSVIYGSSHLHHCLFKAIRIAGLEECIYRNIPLDNSYRICGESLQKLVKEDLENGLKPFLTICSAGTTNCGVIDPINAIADICEKHNLWLHVDGAYGGLFNILEEEKHKFKGINRADSIVVDPHKTLFLPYGLGAVLVKDVETLKYSNKFSADYLQDATDNPDEISPANVSPELTKHFRGLRMWLPLQLHGEDVFKNTMREKLLLTKYFREEVVKIDGIEICNEPDLTIFSYRYFDANWSLEENNHFNEQLIASILKDGSVFLSSTIIDGKFVLRIAILSFRTHKYEIDLALNCLKENIATTLESVILS